MIKRYQDNNCVVLYDSRYITDPTLPIFDSEYWQAEGKITGKAKGRGTTWFLQLVEIQGALRHYNRGGLWGKVIRDSYWFSGWESARSIAEFQLLNQLIDAGVSVPKPVAARVIKIGCFYTADLLSERIENAQDLVSILIERKLPTRVYRLVGQEIARMHKAEVNHTDLNIHNLLIDNNEKVWIIDFDKCKKQVGNGWQSANLERLLRSFRKEQNKRQIQWSEQDFTELKAGYQEFMAQP
ncbi:MULTISPECIES: 3-deoxy-D-manno-octulosonic acid kinase [Vibrio]|uniref:3-deoxy-D-manno-octulosonic acid kinase n=1 Tax=Vibrio TaxID=662 RepID=UPI0005767D4B|nr:MULTISPECIES: 3-deoxy-D-manno-octulosonic acid kinase [Vibrio]MDK9775060.1 3-deoxy-D-manno-octulosonic acid kinase [Vibrio sp. D401a]MDK9807726.1 3-deoxy-D-manno-octulosonic acid kinase [Vibrio sp. D406a]PIB18006.1 3-deoxy-D-manno-octulosonic-acid kinase [Vibrio rotiferianus CAIM 577 = LMG 21460]USD50170.1 3-deoxy-D-manno-octulosonic acid kinase [Vibrio sp. SCSIO 43153]